MQGRYGGLGKQSRVCSYHTPCRTKTHPRIRYDTNRVSSTLHPTSALSLTFTCSVLKDLMTAGLSFDKTPDFTSPSPTSLNEAEQLSQSQRRVTNSVKTTAHCLKVVLLPPLASLSICTQASVSFDLAVQCIRMSPHWPLSPGGKIGTVNSIEPGNSSNFPIPITSSVRRMNSVAFMRTVFFFSGGFGMAGMSMGRVFLTSSPFFWPRNRQPSYTHSKTSRQQEPPRGSRRPAPQSGVYDELYNTNKNSSAFGRPSYIPMSKARGITVDSLKTAKKLLILAETIDLHPDDYADPERLKYVV